MIQNLLQEIIDFFEAREPREQILLLVGVPIIVLLMIYITAIKPSLDRHAELLINLNTEVEFNHWFKQNQSLLTKNSQNSFDWKNKSLPSLIETSINQRGLNTWQKRIFQNRDSQMVVSFKNIPYSKLSTWLSILQLQYRVKIIDASLKATKQKGIVDSQIILSNPD